MVKDDSSSGRLHIGLNWSEGTEVPRVDEEATALARGTGPSEVLIQPLSIPAGKHPCHTLKLVRLLGPRAVTRIKGDIDDGSTSRLADYD